MGKTRVTASIVRALAIAASLSLAACSLAPAYHPPLTPTPAAFKEQGAPAGWAPATPLDAAARGAWWGVFADPVLNDLEARVARASPTLAAALARYDAARAVTREARADLFPQVDATAGAERERVSARRPLGNGAHESFNDFRLGGTLDYELDLWGRVRDGVRAARSDAQASAADLADTRLSLQADLADAYFRLRGFDAERLLLEQTVAAYTRSHDLTVTRHSGGIANGLDVGRAQNVLSAARAQISAVASDRAAAEHAIAALAGEVASSFAISARDDALKPPAIPPGAPSALLQRRPDIAAAERRMAAANARIGVARAALFPQVTLGASGGVESTALGGLFATPATFWALGPAQAALAVIDGGRRRAAVRESRARYDEAVANYRAAILAAFRQVEDALAAARLLAAQSVDQRDAAEAARRTENLALVRYRDGASDYLDVVTAQTAALDAERAAILVATARMRAGVALVRALGGSYGDAPISSPPPVTSPRL